MSWSSAYLLQNIKNHVKSTVQSLLMILSCKIDKKDEASVLKLKLKGQGP
jgi:hypothetical protein